MRWDDKKVLITGINGFIGSNLAKRLLDLNADVIGVDNFEYSNKIWLNEISNKISFFEADVSKNADLEKLKNLDIDFIFHFGSPSSSILFNRFPKKCFMKTIEGMKNVLDLSKAINVRKIVFPSSGSVYGIEFTKISNLNMQDMRKVNLYALAKIACESLAISYAEINWIGLRIFTGYGPREEKKEGYASVVYTFIKCIMEGKSPIIYGDGSQTRDFIYIDNIVDAILKSAEINFNGIIDIGTGEEISFSQLVDLIQKIVAKEIKPVYKATENVYAENIKANTILMKKILEIEPKKVDEGIKNFVHYLENKPEVVKR
ncbi:MAG: NAD-dependent epimerase/dehydratase family protein [Candidatus Aenigmarchaeota archaeon]|nr:NAD-dependent epimerase/dehydratase family protein [Candidatus Aenigmarchaeota archaeon]